MVNGGGEPFYGAVEPMVSGAMGNFSVDHPRQQNRCGNWSCTRWSRHDTQPPPPSATEVGERVKKRLEGAVEKAEAQQISEMGAGDISKYVAQMVKLVESVRHNAITMRTA